MGFFCRAPIFAALWISWGRETDTEKQHPLGAMEDTIIKKWLAQDPCDPNIVTGDDLQRLTGVAKYESITAKFRARPDLKGSAWRERGSNGLSTKRVGRFTLQCQEACIHFILNVAKHLAKSRQIR